MNTSSQPVASGTAILAVLGALDHLFDGNFPAATDIIDDMSAESVLQGSLWLNQLLLRMSGHSVAEVRRSVVETMAENPGAFSLPIE